MIFKLNKDYSSKTIQKHCKDIKISGAVEGGKHTIESGTLKFVMLSEGAWRGTNSIYYKCVKT
jgi:hypothetical protein